MTDTSEQLAQSIKRALEHKMTPEEIWEQRVSFVYGQQDSDSTHRFTKDQIREKLAKIYGYTPVRREGDAGGAVRSMTDISEQLGGPTQPVLRTMREQLLPCPFCGGAPTIGDNPRQPDDITCENYKCPVIVETDVGAFGDAVKIWNTRASTPRQLDAEVVARVQSTVTYDEAWERESYVTLRLSDVKAILAALAVPIATQSTS